MSPEIILNLVLFLPAAGALILALLPKEQSGLIRGTAFWIAIANLVLSVVLLTSFDAKNNGSYQFVTQVSLMKQLHVICKSGLYCTSLLLILLTTLLAAIS